MSTSIEAHWKYIKKTSSDPVSKLIKYVINDIYCEIKCTSTADTVYRNISWWCHQMETFHALLAICAGNSPFTGEFPAQRPVTRSFDVFFDLRLNKQLNKQSWGWWFETLSSSLWRHCNVSARFGCFVAVKSSFLVISRETFTFIFRVVLELRQLLYDYLIACAVTLKEIITFIWGGGY